MCGGNQERYLNGLQDFTLANPCPNQKQATQQEMFSDHSPDDSKPQLLAHPKVQGPHQHINLTWSGSPRPSHPLLLYKCPPLSTYSTNIPEPSYVHKTKYLEECKSS